MIIDTHSHMVAPPGLNAAWTQMEAGGTYGGRIRGAFSDDELIECADRQIKLMDEVGTDVQFTSPRPYTLKHSHRQHQVVRWWVQNNNDAVAVQARRRPHRIQGMGALPQLAGEPVEVVFEELDRCIDELGFIGVLVNPDPGEGDGATPPMGDQYWFPLYERLVDKDIPALLHCAGCYGRENYSEHFISEESLAITTMIRAGVFERFPDLKVIVPHGGGSIPYQLGRWVANWGNRHKLPPEEARQSYLGQLRKFWFDTCLYTPESLDLLFGVVGADRVIFGTERPGSGYAFEDLKPVIEKLSCLDTARRHAVFEGNARALFTRANLPGES